ncbi:hypothetical protein L810_1740 [Burkholderia sp. AU4i]|nr:hypothetical protein L810_1740 [Burkholderia sp. AU4i]
MSRDIRVEKKHRAGHEGSAVNAARNDVTVHRDRGDRACAAVMLPVHREAWDERKR